MDTTKITIGALVVIVALIIMTNAEGLAYCFGDEFTAKYYMNSFCFDFHYRCTIECERYNLNFTGVTDGCACDCGKGWVSSCSGFYYDKDPEGQDLVRIVGDEVVEYPNGTVEPAGYEEGIYAFNKSENIVIDEEHKVG
jgi:hypothetical protein